MMLFLATLVGIVTWQSQFPVCVHTATAACNGHWKIRFWDLRELSAHCTMLALLLLLLLIQTKMKLRDWWATIVQVWSSPNRDAQPTEPEQMARVSVLPATQLSIPGLAFRWMNILRVRA